MAAAVAIGLVLFAIVVTSAHSTPAKAVDPVVTIRAFTFQGALTVTPGATVTVINADTVPHTLTAVDGSFTTPVIPAGATATFVAPATPGAYAIKCNIHASMSGTLTVATEPTPSSPSTTSPATPQIMIMGFAYAGDLTVTLGATVTVTNMDAARHTLTAVDGSFTTPVIPAGATATFVAPATPGAYAIKCNIHASMSGMLTVAADPGPTPTATPEPSASSSPEVVRS
jgi:plastocyanin